MTQTIYFTPDHQMSQLAELTRYLSIPGYEVVASIHRIDPAPSSRLDTYRETREITGEFHDFDSLSRHLHAIKK